MSALVLPGDDFAEVAYNATPVERRYASELSGWLAEVAAFQAATLGHVATLLRDYWGTPGATLMDAMSEAPPEVRAQVIHDLTLSGLLPEA